MVFGADKATISISACAFAAHSFACMYIYVVYTYVVYMLVMYAHVYACICVDASFVPFCRIFFSIKLF